MSDCSTIPVRRAPGSIPCGHCQAHLTDRLDLALLASKDHGPVPAADVVVAWSDFQADPRESTWYVFVYEAARRLGEAATRTVLGDIDPWPIVTEEQAIARAVARAHRVWIDRCATCFTPAGEVACSTRCGHAECHTGWSAPPRSDGRVFDCGRWVTPAEAFECSWDAYSDLQG